MFHIIWSVQGGGGHTRVKRHGKTETRHKQVYYFFTPHFAFFGSCMQVNKNIQSRAPLNCDLSTQSRGHRVGVTILITINSLLVHSKLGRIVTAELSTPVHNGQKLAPYVRCPVKCGKLSPATEDAITLLTLNTIRLKTQLNNAIKVAPQQHCYFSPHAPAVPMT